MTLPHTSATEGRTNRGHVRRMKTTDFRINVGRGMTVWLADLVDGLDVFEIEPLPADHPVWVMPGVPLTPHMAGYGPYLDARRVEILLDNCRRFADGPPLRNVVDRQNWF